MEVVHFQICEHKECLLTVRVVFGLVLVIREGGGGILVLC